MSLVKHVNLDVLIKRTREKKCVCVCVDESIKIKAKNKYKKYSQNDAYIAQFSRVFFSYFLQIYPFEFHVRRILLLVAAVSPDIRYTCTIIMITITFV